MTELLKNASEALIANDATTLERLAHEAASHTCELRASGSAVRPDELGGAIEVLRKQVNAASAQLAMRHRLTASGLQADSWVR